MAKIIEVQILLVLQGEKIMPRKRKTKSDNYYDVFPVRLRQIMEETDTTQQDLADYIGKSRQAIGYYADGSSSPDWKALSSLAMYFGVSSDWLLGLSNTKSTNVTVQEICKQTGLCEDVMAIFTKMSHAEIETINFMVTSSPFKTLISYMTSFFAVRNTPDTKSLPEKDLNKVEEYLKGTSYTIIHRGELKRICEREATEAFKRIFYSDAKHISLKDI